MKKNEIRPKQYTHIDYEALLIYVMKNNVSLEEAIKENNLSIARSTVIRNIRKIKQDYTRDTAIIDYYQNVYVKNSQKSKIPDEIKLKIDSFEQKPVKIKNELEDLYNKLSIMNSVLQQTSGNYTEATRIINSGTTKLGRIKPITVQAFRNDIKYFERIKEEMEEKIREEKEGVEK